MNTKIPNFKHSEHWMSEHRNLWTSHFGPISNFEHVEHHKKLNSSQTSNCSFQDYSLYKYTYITCLCYLTNWRGLSTYPTFKHLFVECSSIIVNTNCHTQMAIICNLLHPFLICAYLLITNKNLSSWVTRTCLKFINRLESSRWPISIETLSLFSYDLR